MASLFDHITLPGGDMFSSSDDAFFDNTFTMDNTFGNDSTISPQELFLEDERMIFSAPPSTAFANLSTPDSGMLESPAMASSGFNTSPMENLDGSFNFDNDLYPLFPHDDQIQACPPFNNVSMKLNISNVKSQSTASASPMTRQKSSPGRPPAAPLAHARKHSLSTGIVKSTPKPRKTLPEITIESEDDKEIAKRKKNTAAARKSRQRKQENLEQMEAEIQRLRQIVYRMGGNPDEE